jgi:hypothetical protein
MAEIAIVPVVMGAGGMYTAATNGKEDNVFFMQSWDLFSNYYKFSSEYSDRIDKILMDSKCGTIGNRIVVSEKSFIPGEGIHEYRGENPEMDDVSRWLKNLNFYKRIKTVNGVENVTYYCQVPLFAKIGPVDVFNEVLVKIFREDDRIVRIVSIDTSGNDLRLFIKNQIFKTPTPIQSQIGNRMIEHYFHPGKNNNVKLLITGERGSQKTYMGKVIKKMLNAYSSNIVPKGQINASLIDNFNPKDYGVNIETMILNKATEDTPVIIVINEYDTIMDYVVDTTKQMYDFRLCHAKDKSTFNNMLDNLGDTQYCITIFTSETSVSDLLGKNPDFKSFLRKGRVDYYVSMTKDAYEITEVKQ